MRKYFTAAGGILLSAALLLFFYFYNNSIFTKKGNNYPKEQKSSEFSSNKIVFSFPESTLILEGQLKEKIFPYIENPKVNIVSRKLTLKGKAKRAVIIFTGRVNIINFSGIICNKFPVFIKKIYFEKGYISIRSAKIKLNRKSHIRVKNLPPQKVKDICRVIEKIKSSYATITESKLPEE